jgi:hypothetical protein
LAVSAIRRQSLRSSRRRRSRGKALIVANHFLETDLEKLKAAVSMGLCTSVLAAGF